MLADAGYFQTKDNAVENQKEKDPEKIPVKYLDESGKEKAVMATAEETGSGVSLSISSMITRQIKLKSRPSDTVL